MVFFVFEVTGGQVTHRWTDKRTDGHCEERAVQREAGAASFRKLLQLFHQLPINPKKLEGFPFTKRGPF